MLPNFLKPVVPLATFINLVVFLASCALIFFHPDLPPKVPLWFSLPWGEERLAPNTYLWLLPGLIFFFFLSSNLAAKKINSSQEVLARILVWSSAFISLVFLLTLYKIILIGI